MEATRRGIMGILGGAIAAGPALAKNIAAEIGAVEAAVPSELMYAAKMAAGSLNYAVDPPLIRKDPNHFAVRRLAEIKKLLRDGVAPEGLDTSEQRDLTKMHYKSLKSVTPTNQRRMYAEECNRRAATQRKKYLMDEMLELLGLKPRQTGANECAPYYEEKPW